MKFRTTVYTFILALVLIAASSCTNWWDHFWYIQFPTTFQGTWSGSDSDGNAVSVEITSRLFTIRTGGRTTTSSEAKYKGFDWIETDPKTPDDGVTRIEIHPMYAIGHATNKEGKERVDVFEIEADGRLTITFDINGSTPEKYGPLTKPSSPEDSGSGD